MVLLLSADFCFKLTFSKISNSLNPDQDDIVSVLIWVQLVCKGYQQTIKVSARLLAIKERVKKHDISNESHEADQAHIIWVVIVCHCIQFRGFRKITVNCTYTEGVGKTDMS